VEASFQTSTGIGDLEAFLTKTGTQAFIVIQDDAILYEGYFNGAQRDSIVTSFSVAKSFASALVGIAIQEGYIQSADDPIAHYLPNWRLETLVSKRSPSAICSRCHRDYVMMMNGLYSMMMGL